MQLNRTALAVCLALPVTLAFALPATKLAFAPKAGSEAKKTFSLEADLSITELTGDMNGQPLPPEATEQLTSQGILINMALAVTDVYAATKDGKPTELLRTYDSIEIETEMGEETTPNDDAKAMEGKTVKFTWDEKESEYSKAFHESEGDEALIKELEADMDLICLLPSKDLDDGDSWEVPAKDLSTLFFPGGLIGSAEADSEGPDMSAIVEEMQSEFEKAAEAFKVTCTYKGVAEKDGMKVGEVAFVYDGKMSMDMSDMLQQVIEEQGGDQEMPPMDLTFTLGMGMKGEGTLWWNMSENRLHGYEMTADADMELAMEMNMDANGQQIGINFSGRAKGDMTWKLEPTAAKKE